MTKLPLNRMLTSRGFKYLGKRAGMSQWSRRDFKVSRISNPGNIFVIVQPLPATLYKPVLYSVSDEALKRTILVDFSILHQPTTEVDY